MNIFKKIKAYIQSFPPLPKVYGTHGRIEIPNLKISLPLYDAKGDAQTIVDRKNAAAFIKWSNQDVIADHSGQDGFERLEFATPGNTLAFIVYNNGKPSETYICTQKQIGHILMGTKNKLVDAKNVPPQSNGLIMYTCIHESAINIMDVWLTYWKKI